MEKGIPEYRQLSSTSAITTVNQNPDSPVPGRSSSRAVSITGSTGMLAVAGQELPVDSETPLMSREIIRFKTEKMAEEKKRDVSALFDAVCKPDSDTVKALIKKDIAIVNFTDHSGRTALHIASEHGHTDIAAYLVTQGATVNTPDNMNETPLHKAVWKGHKLTVDYLINARANINHPGYFQTQTPLFCAASSNNIEIMKQLITHGADVNFGRKLTPLSIAISYFDDKVVRLLLDSKANVNADLDGCGSNALHCLFRRMSNQQEALTIDFQPGSIMTISPPLAFMEILQILVDTGAEMNRKDHMGEKPLDKLFTNESTSYFKELPRKWSCFDKKIQWEILCDLKILHFIQSKGIDPTDRQYISKYHQLTVQKLLSTQMNDLIALKICSSEGPGNEEKDALTEAAKASGLDRAHLSQQFF